MIELSFLINIETEEREKSTSKHADSEKSDESKQAELFWFNLLARNWQ